MRKRNTRRKVTDWSDEVLSCRGRGHHWTADTASRISGGFDVQEVCEVCGSTRRLMLDNRGYRVDKPKINYVDGYQSPKGSGPWTSADRAAVRLALVQLDLKPGRRSA
jgi:hypothetical protein